MATLAKPVPIRLTDERKFFAGMALIMVALTFVGFAPSYYLAPAFGAKPLSMLLHVHGMVYTLWMVLYLVQTGLVSARRTDIHRLIGPAGVTLAVVMVPLGVATAIIGKQVAAASHLPPSGPPLIFPIGAILTFAVLIGAGIAMRGRSAWHKRLMLLGTLAIVTTPLARITRFMHLGLTPPLGGMVLSDLLLIGLVAYDLRTRARLHPATLWGGGFFLATQAGRVLLNMTPAWQAFAKGLTG
nr:Unknown Function [uncultured bacterium]